MKREPIILKTIAPVLRVILGPGRKRRPAPVGGNEIKLALATAILVQAKPPPPPAVEKRVRFAATGVIELQLIKPILKPRLVNPKKHKHAMNKQMRDIVTGEAEHDEEAAARQHLQGGDGSDGGDGFGEADVRKAATRIQMMRATNAVYAGVSRLLIGRLNEAIIWMQNLKETRFDNPRETILETYARIRWNSEREIYEEEAILNERMMHLIMTILQKNELPGRRLGLPLEQAWHAFKYEIANAVITHRAPSDRAMEGIVRDINEFTLAYASDGEDKEPVPTDAVEFAVRAGDILGDRIDALLGCIHDIHRFTASIAVHLVVPTFSHHITFTS